MCIFTYISIDYPLLSSEVLAAVHSVNQAQEALCDGLFIPDLLLDGLVKYGCGSLD